MSESVFFQDLLIASLIIATGTFVILFYISAPYGRQFRGGWGPSLSNWLGWLLMESVSAILMPVLFFLGDAPRTAASVVFLIMWEAHYLQRAFIYPFLLRNGHKQMPLVITLLAAAFNLGNVYLNGRYLFHFADGRYGAGWLLEPRFLAGAALFVAGFGLNRWADNALRNLRRLGETGYSVPQGGLFQYIACPNYLGEIVEWIGWALATWSLPGLAFAVWTFANLAPRAWSHHKWYRRQFPDYPPGRKALIPGIW